MPANPIVSYPLSGGSATLPTATGAGQVLTSSGAGTTYTAQTPAISLIQEQIVSGSSVASVTFSAIPGTFKHLKLVGQFSATSGNLAVQFNGDVTTGHYSYQIVYGNVLTANGLDNQSTTGILIAFPQGAVELDIPGYTNASLPLNVVSKFAWSAPGTANQFAGTSGGGWSGTLPVTSITIAATGNLAIGSTFSLYGLQ